MSLDEMARASARRTTQRIATSYDTERAYRELVAVHRNRVRAKVVGASALVLAVLLVVAVGAGGSARHRSEPIAPQPRTKSFLAAPPICGSSPLGQEFAQYVDVGHRCPSGPGRYLSLLAGVGSQPPFAFTVPSGWTVRGLSGAGGGPVVPGLGGLFLQARSGGHGVVLAEYPTEMPAFSSTDGSGEAPRDIAARLAGHEYVRPTTVVATTLGHREAWRVDLVQPEETGTDGVCVTGDRCAVTFGLARDSYPGRSYLGVVPDVPSTAYLLYGSGSGIITLAWTYGDPDSDPALAQVLESIDFDPPVCGVRAATCSRLAAPYVGTWHSSVSTREAGTAFHALVGNWTMTLTQDGSARLTRAGGTPKFDGGWSLDGTDLKLGLSLPGCVTDDAEYRPTVSALHPGLLELEPIESQESCRSRSLVLGGHWSSRTGSGS